MILKRKFINNENNTEINKFQKSGIHHPDYTPVAIAFNNCDCIVTFNIKDFSPAIKFISVFSPDDL